MNDDEVIDSPHAGHTHVHALSPDEIAKMVTEAVTSGFRTAAHNSEHILSTVTALMQRQSDAQMAIVTHLLGRSASPREESPLLLALIQVLVERLKSSDGPGPPFWGWTVPDLRGKIWDDRADAWVPAHARRPKRQKSAKARRKTPSKPPKGKRS